MACWYCGMNPTTSDVFVRTGKQLTAAKLTIAQLVQSDLRPAFRVRF